MLHVASHRLESFPDITLIKQAVAMAMAKLWIIHKWAKDEALERLPYELSVEATSIIMCMHV